VDKERSNFCDYFHFLQGSHAGRASAGVEGPRAALEALFRKRQP
jgi:hypothetical protein